MIEKKYVAFPIGVNEQLSLSDDEVIGVFDEK